MVTDWLGRVHSYYLALPVDCLDLRDHGFDWRSP